MSSKISVDKAIQKGQLLVNLPVVIILFGLIAISTELSAQYTFFAVLIFISAFILAWLYWSFAITKWKLWAYQNVEDLVELKKAAVKSNLIWADGNFFNKTEIKSKKEELLEKKLLEKANATFVPAQSPTILYLKLALVYIAVLVLLVLVKIFLLK